MDVINTKAEFELDALIKNIGVIYSDDVLNAHKIADDVRHFLDKKGLNSKIIRMQNLESDITLAVVIGGDGTLLRASRFYSNYETPVFGINLGRLGFLSQTNPEKMRNSLEKILNGEFQIENRTMLAAQNTDLCALNDIVIKGATTNRTSKFFLSINDNSVCEYLADGLIISTPTGSTAYNLSAGGPILVPSLDAFVITPICAHTLTVRPLVIPSDEVITIKICENEMQYTLIADGQISKSCENTQNSVIKRHSKAAKLILLDKEPDGFYAVLRKKLHWAVAPKS